MSLVDFQHSCPPAQVSPTEHSHPPPTPARSVPPPNHINLSAPQVLGALVSSPNPSPPPRDNPFDSPPSSPPLPFYTAPSTPLTSPQAEDPPLDPPLSLQLVSEVACSLQSLPRDNFRLASSVPPPGEIETIPLIDAQPGLESTLDFTLDDEGLNTLEKIYLFSRSRSAHHRVFISHALPSFLAQVTPLEAVEYVLPLLPSLAMDEDEAVKEALSSELVGILWSFLTRCQLVEDPGESLIHDADCQPNYIDGDVTLISVQAFTPILGTLLLSPNGMVSGPARCAVVDLLGRIRKADTTEEQGIDIHQSVDESCGLFGRAQRKMFEEEVLHQLVIGIGRLDIPVEEDISEIWYDASARTPATEIPTQTGVEDTYDPNINPYFPPPPSPLSTTVSLPLPALATSISAQVPQVSVVPPSPPPGVIPLPLEFSTVDPPSPITCISYHYEGGGSSPTRMSGSQTPVPAVVPQPQVMQENHEMEDEVDPSEQAAVGRLSSMSLIAAVTASTSLRTDAQRAFVREVERAGKDPVYWVRREASFALGALAKVVPEELLISSLLPLFESLRSDPVWHVRHSSLFALPAVLSRLSPYLRRSVALSTVIPLYKDESPTVRSGVLEALGEVIHTFHVDQGGPPSQLLRLFLGREKSALAGEQRPSVACGIPCQLWPVLDLNCFDDPARPLACAFNYPAVALTLGPARWGELRGFYLTLAQNRSSKVRRTLAASLGELARVIGPENAARDLIHVWWDAMRCDEDGDIRLKVIEALPLFVDALGDGKARDDIFAGLVKIWEEGWLSRSWRARECLIQVLPDLAGSPTHPDCLHHLVQKGLEDSFGTVRDAAINVVTRIYADHNAWAVVLDRLRRDIVSLAHSSSYRKRMTYVSCQQSLASLTQENAFVMDDTNWEALRQLADDRVMGVRIGVARLAKTMYDQHIRSFPYVAQRITDLMDDLRRDTSAEVRSYVADTKDDHAEIHRVMPNNSGVFATFSRPPPVSHRL
ncbi:armadillo-type protein [Scleroderma citrinum]